MDLTLVLRMLPNGLNGLLALVFFSTSLRAFFLYAHLRSPRLFILGVAMGVIAVTALVDLISGTLTDRALHTEWFLFLGQTISFVWIVLSLVRTSDQFLRRLILCQIISTVLVLSLLVLSPLLPDFPNGATRMVFSGSRAVGCLLLFGYYTEAFASKGTRFSLLMSIAFALLSIGYSLILPTYIFANQDSLDQIGDGIRIVGLLILLSAYLKG